VRFCFVFASPESTYVYKLQRISILSLTRESKNITSLTTIAMSHTSNSQAKAGDVSQCVAFSFFSAYASSKERENQSQICIRVHLSLVSLKITRYSAKNSSRQCRIVPEYTIF